MKQEIPNASCTRSYYRGDYQNINVHIKIANKKVTTQHVVNSKAKWNSGSKEKYRWKEIIKVKKKKYNKEGIKREKGIRNKKRIYGGTKTNIEKN